MTQPKRVLRVKRILIAQYDVDMKHYEGMTDAEAIAWEQDLDDPAVAIDNITDEIVDARVVEVPDE